MFGGFCFGFGFSNSGSDEPVRGSIRFAALNVACADSVSRRNYYLVFTCVRFCAHLLRRLRFSPELLLLIWGSFRFLYCAGCGVEKVLSILYNGYEHWGLFLSMETQLC